MKFNTSNAVIAIISFLMVTPAWARDPAPPPSGIVIHLFGQNSIMSNILPTTPSAAAPAANITAAATSTAAGAAQPATTYVEPTAGDILHQMFVTGDGSPVKPAAGRVADRPAN